MAARTQKKLRSVYKQITALLRQRMHVAKAIDDSIDPSTPGDTAQLFEDAGITLDTSMYKKAFAIGSESAKFILGENWKGQVDTKAVNQAIQGRQTWLSKTISQNHAPRVQQIVANGIESGSAYSDIAQELSDALGIENESLAYTIAQTESQWSVNEARRLDYSRLGLDLMDVDIAPDACELCVSVASENPYSVDDSQDLVPIHPRCRCALVPHFDFEE